MLLSVAQTGKYRLEEDWTQGDPEAGHSASTFDDPEAGGGGGFRAGKGHLTVETQPEESGRVGGGEAEFFNPSKVSNPASNPAAGAENGTSYGATSHAATATSSYTTATASQSYSYAAVPPSAPAPAFSSSGPKRSPLLSPQEAMSQIPKNRRLFSSKLVVNNSLGPSMQGSMGSLESHRNFSPQNQSTVEHPGADIIWQGCYLWKVPFSSNKVPRVRWVQSVYDVDASGGRGVYLKWHDPKNTRKPARSLAVSTVVEIVTGQKTNAFFTQVNKRGRDSLPPVSLCFSLICNERTVDLAATNQEDYRGWVDGLRSLLSRTTHQPSKAGFRKPNMMLEGANRADAGADMGVPDPAHANSSSLTKEELRKVWQTTLFDHCRHNRLNEVREVLNEGCDVDLMERGTGDTALMVACRKGRTHIVKLCLERGAKNDPHPQFGQTALQAAISHGHAKCATVILDKAKKHRMDCVIVNHADPNKDAPLHIAARLGNMRCLECLLEHGADYTLVDAKGRTPLHVACAHNQVEVATVLVELAGDLDVGDHQGNTPLHIATAANGDTIVQLLLQTAADPRCMNESGKTPLDMAQALGHHSCEMVMREGLMNVVGTPRSQPFFNRCLKPGESPQRPTMQQQQHHHHHHKEGALAPRDLQRSWSSSGYTVSSTGSDGGIYTPRGNILTSPRAASSPHQHAQQQAQYAQQQQHAQGYDQHAAMQGARGSTYGSSASQATAGPPVSGTIVAGSVNGGKFTSRLFDGLDVAGSYTKTAPGAMSGSNAAGHQGHQLQEGSYYDYAAVDSQYDTAAAEGDGTYHQHQLSYDADHSRGAWYEEGSAEYYGGEHYGASQEYGSAETNYYGSKEGNASADAGGGEWVQDEEGNWCKMVDGVAWAVQYTDDGDPYYVNGVSGESQWEEPLAAEAHHQHDYGETYWAESAEATVADASSHATGASQNVIPYEDVGEADDQSFEVYTSREGGMSARQQLRARLAHARSGGAPVEGKTETSIAASLATGAVIGAEPNLTRAQRLRMELAKGREARKKMHSMEAEMTRLQDTARSTGSGGASDSPRSVGHSNSNSGGRSPVTLAAAAAAAARRTGSPSAEAGSKSAWGEGKNDTLGRSEGKTSPESTYSAESSSRTLVPTSAPEPAVLSAGTAKIMEKYARMRKMGIPDGAIRHKMKQDGVDAANIAGFFISASNPVVRRATPAVARDSATASSKLNALQSREDLKKYFKMKKLGLPDGAIRQKMQKDGMSGVDIAAFFGERPPAAAAAAPPPPKSNRDLKTRDDMKKYFKMKKMGLPEGAVRQKMQKDGVNAADIAAFFGESLPAVSTSGSDLKSRADLKKYFKMKKMGLPDGAIRQKMQTDGISASDSAAFFGEAPPADSSKNGVHVPRIDLSALRAKQTARRAEMETAGGAMSKYFKMQSMGIPVGAIRMKMKTDGIDSADIAAFCGDMPAGGPPGRPATIAEQKSQQARLKLKKLHWKKLDSTRAQKSVWGRSMSQKTARSDSARDKDMDELAKHFGQKSSKGKKDGRQGRRGSSLGSGAAESKAPKRLLDGKRARNIEIGLAQFRAFKKYEDIGECVASLDESRISADRLETLLDISPTQLETQMFEGHVKGGTDVSALGAAEKFHLATSKVARFREKVRAFLFKAHFSDSAEQLEGQARTLCEAIDQITMSKKLTRVLETVLSVGNLMNQGTHAGDAVGITLDSLLKLTSTKSHDNKMTVLDYVVQTMLKSKEKRVHTSFPEELSQLRNATKCAPKVIKSGLVTLQKGIAHMKREGERDSAASALDSADAKGSPSGNSKFTRGCQRFLARSGEPKVNELSNLLENAEAACAKLKEHFGEDPKSDVVSLFNTLEKFSAAFAKSVKKHLEMEDRRARMLKAKENKERSRQSRRHSRSPERGGGRRASRSPVGRRHRRSRSVEGKTNGDRVANEGKTGGANLLAAIMAKGGLRGLKTDISLKATASPGTRQRHEALQELMASLIQMKHPRDEVKSIAERLASGRSADSIADMADSEDAINRALDQAGIARVMSASDRRVAEMRGLVRK